MNAKKKLKEQVSDFRKWLADNFSEEEIKDDRVDSPSYPAWGLIENLFSTLIENDEIKELDEEDCVNLLYLIGRNWDIGNMLAWLSPAAPLSYCGTLKHSDFIKLARVVKKLKSIEFHDAHSQIIISFQKFPELTKEIEEILLEFYEDKEEHSKRMALLTLGKLNYPKITKLVERTWVEQEEEDEYHKMICLEVIDEYIKDSEFMNKYLSLAEQDHRPYISKFVKELRNKEK